MSSAFQFGATPVPAFLYGAGVYGGAPVDTMRPVMSGAITLSALTSVSYVIGGWSATDNVGVAAYQLSLDGGATWSAIGLDISRSIGGRVPGTTDAVRVRAVDAAGNVSDPLSLSVTLPVQTQVEPVTVAEAKLAARLDADDTTLDLLIEGAIAAARESAEHITGRAYRRKQITEEFLSWRQVGRGLAVTDPSACEIQYWSPANRWELLPPSSYEYAAFRGRTDLAPASGASWPELGTRPVGARVRVSFTVGPAFAGDVPECVKLYIKASVSTWVRNPQALMSGNLAPNPLYARLLDAELTFR